MATNSRDTTMNGPRGTKRPLDSEDEWEYEYSKSETEDFYVMLDLTSHIPPDQRRTFPGREKPPPEKKGTGGRYYNKPGSKAKKKQKTANTGDEEANGNGQSASNEITIANLHDEHPTIAVNDKKYNMAWTTSTHTNMLFTAPERRNFAPVEQKPSPFADLSSYDRAQKLPAYIRNVDWNQPKASEPEAEYLGATNMVLVAQPVQPAPKIRSLRSNGTGEPITPATPKGHQLRVGPSASKPKPYAKQDSHGEKLRKVREYKRKRKLDFLRRFNATARRGVGKSNDVPDTA